MRKKNLRYQLTFFSPIYIMNTEITTVYGVIAMLNYQALYYFLEVSAAQSFTLAAENLNMTRPALSTAIKNLEKELGFPLLHRNHDGVTLTQQGEIVVHLAQKGFAFFDEIEQLNKYKQDTPETLSIYTTQAFTTTLLPDVIHLYYELYPNGKITLSPVDNTTPDEILKNNPDAIVFGIFNESRAFAEYVSTIVLDRSKSYLAMRQDAPFLPKDIKSVTFKDILHIPLISTKVHEEQNMQTDLMNLLCKYGTPNIKVTVAHIGMSTPLVMQNLGATFYISFKLLKDTATSQYRTVSIKNAPKFILAALHHKDIPQEKLDCFLSLINQIK